MDTVLIVTSGIGSRLGGYTEYTNKSLVRVGPKFAICHIIDKYDLKTTRFVVTVGYYGNLVQELLSLAYPENTFVYAQVDNFKGPGSSLGYSLLKAREYLQCPFTFYCCDSIVLDDIQKPTTNTLYVARSDDSSSYASICTNGKVVLNINEKGQNNFDYVYTGVSYIHDYAEYWSNLQTKYEENPANTSLGDCQVIDALIKSGVQFNYTVLEKWFDIGNIYSYNVVCDHFKCEYNVLYKKDESICFFDDKVIKFFSSKKKNLDRVERGHSLGTIIPKILGNTEHFFSMELVKGNVLSEYYVHGEVYNVLNWAKDNLWVNKSTSPSHLTTCQKFYKDKTFERIASLRIGKEFDKINGLSLVSISDILARIDWESLYTDTFYQFHGDFIMDNIIKTSDSFKLIDWRQDFGDELFLGDMYYDMAKFRHNIIFNHLNVDTGLFTLKIENDEVVVDLKCNYFLISQLVDFDRFVYENNFNLKKIKILTTLIWLNMSPLHDINISKFLFYFGKYNLHLELNTPVPIL